MFYEGETVRLVRDLLEPDLPKHAEGRVMEIERDEEGHPLRAEICFQIDSQRVTAKVSFETVELVLKDTGSCQAVFWGLAKPAPTLIEGGLKAIFGLPHHGFQMRQGLNVMQMIYDPEERFWRKGERISDPTGAQTLAVGPGWDGCVVAFSGRQRFELEFRLRGRRDPYVMLHQRWETYKEQSVSTPSAMTLLRVMANLYQELGAEYCAIPVASNWLMDEDWNSLLREPYYPDLFIIPETRLPAQLPRLYRSQCFDNGRAILTTLPVKFSPVDDSIERSERELKLDQLRACKAIGEKAYDQMYELYGGSATGLYSDAKEAFYDAIRVANELGLSEEEAELYKRLEHIKAVFRSQFT